MGSSSRPTGRTRAASRAKSSGACSRCSTCRWSWCCRHTARPSTGPPWNTRCPKAESADQRTDAAAGAGHEPDAAVAGDDLTVHLTEKAVVAAAELGDPAAAVSEDDDARGGGGDAHRPGRVDRDLVAIAQVGHRLLESTGDHHVAVGVCLDDAMVDNGLDHDRESAHLTRDPQR